MTIYQPGDKVPDEGIFLRRWQHAEKTYNVFVAPEDIGGTRTYIDAQKHVASLNDWNGHDGADLANEDAFLAALNNGSYMGGWIIPSRLFLIEMEILKEIGAFLGTYTTESIGSDAAHWYWSSSEHRRHRDFVWDVDFRGGDVDWDHKDGCRLSARPVRVALAI